MGKILDSLKRREGNGPSAAEALAVEGAVPPPPQAVLNILQPDFDGEDVPFIEVPNPNGPVAPAAVAPPQRWESGP